MIIRVIAGALVLTAFAAGLGGSPPPAKAHLFSTPEPPFCRTCGPEYRRYRRVFERTEAWYVYQRELHETIPAPRDRPYYGVRSFWDPYWKGRRNKDWPPHIIIEEGGVSRARY